MDIILDEIENTYKNHNYCLLCMYRPIYYKSYLMKIMIFA